jgi:capsular polysaccharide biosynthesis protein
MAVPYFYSLKSFVGERAKLLPRTATLKNVHIYSENEKYKNKLLGYFNSMPFERAGVLMGEYLLMPSGQLLVDENETFVKINLDGDDAGEAMPSFLIHQQAMPDEASAAFRQTFMREWNNIAVFDDLPIISTFWNSNYFHFSLEMLPKFSLFEQFKPKMFAIPGFCLSKPVQVDLIRRAVVNRTVVPFTAVIRLKNPLLCHTYLSHEGVMWLRCTTGFRVRPGPKRYYLRRVRSTRVGGFGGVAEDAAFVDFLARFGFETLDFGSGEHTVADQLKMLEGAQVILSPHGASLTNITYLSEPLTIIELFSHNHLAGMYLHLADMLNFNYHGIISDQHDSNGNINIDVSILETIMNNL